MPHDNEPNEPMDLTEFDDAFGAADGESSNEYDDVPDGKYQVFVDSVEVTRSKEKQKRMLKWTLRITGPKQAGRLLWKYHMIESAENMVWLKRDLWTCGLKIEKLSDLQVHLTDLLDVGLTIEKKVKVNKTTGKKFDNIYFKGCIEIGDEQKQAAKTSDPGNIPPPEEPDDLPF